MYFVYVGCMHVCEHRCEDPRMKSTVFPPSMFLRLARLPGFKDPPVSMSLCWSYKRMFLHTASCVGSGDLNSSPRVHGADTLPTETAPQPLGAAFDMVTVQSSEEFDPRVKEQREQT